MEKDSDGFAKSARLKKASPTSSERWEFRLLMIVIAIFLGASFAFAIIGVSMIFWRLMG